MKKLFTLLAAVAVFSACSKGGSSSVKPPPVTKTPTQKLLATGTWVVTRDTLGANGTVETSNFGTVFNNIRLNADLTFQSSAGSGTYSLDYDTYQGETSLFAINFTFTASGKTLVYGIDSVTSDTLCLNYKDVAAGPLPDPHGGSTTYAEIAEQFKLVN